MSSQNDLPAEPIVRPRMPELDSLRGIAILSVLLFHAFDTLLAPSSGFWQRTIRALAAQGWAGVNLFFVLSGFLITGILIDSVNRPDYYSRFYSGRILRIFPAYYLLLLLLAAWCFVTRGAPRDYWPFVGLSVVYLANLANMFGIHPLYPLLWSLSVEEHFYLVWPSLIKLLTKRGLAIAAGLICVIEPLLRLYAVSAGTVLWWAGLQYSGNFRYTWMVADALALGALLALWGRSKWGTRENFLNLAIAIFILADVVAYFSRFLSPALAVCLQSTLVNYDALAIVAGALWLGTGVHRRWANIRVLSFYGYISYGLYLIHGLIFVMYTSIVGKLAPSLAPDTNFAATCLKLAICLAIATGLAYLSRVTYEERFLRLKDSSAKTKPSKSTVAAA